MKITKLDIWVAILAGLTVLTLKFHFAVWALFIGWAWYFALGAKIKVFKAAIPALLVGYVLAAVSILVYTATNLNLYALMIAVGATVFLVMLSLKVPLFNCSLASFNAYSCLFAGYYASDFPKVSSSALDLNNVLIAIFWLALGNIVGIGFGFLSVTLGNLKLQKTAAVKKAVEQ